MNEKKTEIKLEIIDANGKDRRFIHFSKYVGHQKFITTDYYHFIVISEFSDRLKDGILKPTDKTIKIYENGKLTEIFHRDLESKKYRR